MLPYKSLIAINRDGILPVYIQICNQLIHLIKSGQLQKKTKLPGSRKLAVLLGIHRKTIIAAYDELYSQGWIAMQPSKGTFVIDELPVIHQIPITQQLGKWPKEKAGFAYKTNACLHRGDPSIEKYELSINDGIPDVRLAPVIEIARTYRQIITRKNSHLHLSYGSQYGHIALREVIVEYLNDSRGLSINVDNVLITRGSQMGIYLAAEVLLDSNKCIVVGETNYIAADLTFKNTGAKIKRIPVDKDGIVTSELEKMCKSKKINAVYVTPHHHHPTTVTLSAARRVELLKLAFQFGFAIIEDDYDYDFHYSHSPILPLASGDNDGMVIYLGALCKLLSPAIRVGYIVAPKNIIDEIAHLRRIIDRQGDNILEMTMAQMMKLGDIQRHSKKALKIYKTRRDVFCKQLREQLGDVINFNTPEGGMAVWAELHKDLHWESIHQRAKRDGLFLEHHAKYDPMHQGHNGIRMGFASLNEKEILIAIDKLKKAVSKVDRH